MTCLKDLSIERSTAQVIHEECAAQKPTLSRDAIPLEAQNNELQKDNAKLAAIYEAAQDTIFQLECEKTTYASCNSRLEAAIADACNTIDGIVGSGTPVTPYDKLCAESWDRNKIVEARVRIESTDTDDELHANGDADTSVLDEQHAARELELRCDCGITFNVTGDNLASIKTGHRSSKSQKRRRTRAKRKGMTSVDAMSDDASGSTSASVCQLASARLRCGRQRHDAPDVSEAVFCSIFLVFIFIVFYHMDAPCRWPFFGL